MDKRSVGIKKILIDCVRFWYLLVLFVILGTLGGWRAGIAYNKNVDKQWAEAEEKKAKEEEAAIELTKDDVEEVTFTKAQCEKKLSKDAMADVLEAYGWYQDRSRRREYLESSPYMKLDPYDFTSTYLQFRVVYEGESWSEKNFNSYIHGLKNYVIYNGMVDEFYPNDITAARNLSELVSISDGGKDKYDDLLLITVMKAPETEGMVDRIRNSFIAYGDKMAETYPGYKVEFMSQYQANYYNGGLNSSIETHRGNISSDGTKIEAAMKKFSSMQQAYYNMLVNGTEKETIEEVVLPGVAAKKTAAKEEEEVLPTKKRLWIMTSLGAAAGGVLAVLVLFLANLLSGRLLFRKDLQNLYGIRSCGIVRERNKKGISGMLQRAEFPDAEDAEEPAIYYLQLREAMKAADCKEAVLVGTGSLDGLKSVDSLVTMAKKDGITLSVEEGFPGELASAETVLEKGTVLLVERMHKSRLSEIDKVVHFCRENNVKIIGAVGADL